MATFEQVMALATLPEVRLPLCLDARLQGELDDLRAQLANAGPATSLGQRSPAAAVQERIDEVIEKMRASEVTFVLRALSGREWTAHFVSKPEREPDEPMEDYGERLFPWMARLVSKCCIDPVMTPEQVAQLVDKLHADAWVNLQNACTKANQGEVKPPPNFAAVSALTPSSQTTSPPASSPGSVTPPSGEHNGAVRRRTPTKRAAKPAA